MVAVAVGVGVVVVVVVAVGVTHITEEAIRLGAREVCWVHGIAWDIKGSISGRFGHWAEDEQGRHMCARPETKEQGK